MQYVAQLVLLFIHAIYGLKNLLFSFIPSRNPKPLLARRKKVPGHIAFILVPNAVNSETGQEEAVMEQCIESAIKWCKTLGISHLSIYERDGILAPASAYAFSVESSSLLDVSRSTTQSNGGGRDPLTPPESDTDSPRPLSPELVGPMLETTMDTLRLSYLSSGDSPELDKKLPRRRRHSPLFKSKPPMQTLTLHLLSRESSKPALALVTRSLAHKYATSSEKSRFLEDLTVDVLNNMIEVESGYPPPDLIIVYTLYPSTAPLELHGFPPWHMRLSEIYHASSREGGVYRQLLRWMSSRQKRSPSLPKPISEWEFRRALDEYSDAQFRLGK